MAWGPTASALSVSDVSDVNDGIFSENSSVGTTRRNKNHLLSLTAVPAVNISEVVMIEP